MARKIKNDIRGFSLLELLIVISIMSIMAYIGVKYIISAMEKSKVEEDLKKMYGLLQEARIKAFTQKEDFTFSLNVASKEACILDKNNNKVKCITLNKSDYSVNNNIKIDKRGTFTRATIDYTGTVSNLSYNCIKVSNLRVILGVDNGSGCEAKE